MERPSHGNFKSSHPFSSRLVASGLALSVPLAILWGLANGMGTQIIEHVAPIFARVIADPKRPLPPPPQPVLDRVEPIKPITPIIPFDNPSTDDSAKGGVLTLRPEPQTSVPEPPPAGPSRAARAVGATHTSPPYPLMSIRMQEHGRVTLLLSVAADGHVAKADIVASSGFSRLDAAAQAWIVSHWRYQPALDKGVAIASQMRATVLFDLKDVR